MRPPPRLPEDFEKELRKSKTFTNGKEDYPVVCDLYRKAFVRAMGSATQLRYNNLDWGDQEAVQLAEVIWSGELKQVETIHLTGNPRIGEAGRQALELAFESGKAPQLVELEGFISKRQIAPDIVAAFRSVDRDCSGSIDASELQLLLKRLGIEVRESTLRPVLSRYDGTTMELKEAAQAVEFVRHRAEEAKRRGLTLDDFGFQLPS